MKLKIILKKKNRVKYLKKKIITKKQRKKMNKILRNKNKKRKNKILRNKQRKRKKMI